MPASSGHVFLSRGALILCAVLVFLIVAANMCGGNTRAFLWVFFTSGLPALGWMVGAGALGSILLSPFRLKDFPEVSLPFRIATAGGLGLGAFSLIGLGLGMLGWLNQPVAIALPAISALAAGVMFVRPARMRWGQLARWLRRPAGFGWLWLIAVVSLAMACISASLMPGILWKQAGDPHPYDVLSYHLLVPREWYEGGRIVPLSHNVFSYFPFNVEMQFLLLMHAMGGPFTAMCACQYVNVGYTVFLVLAVLGAGRPVPVGSELAPQSFRSPAIAAILIATVPWVIMLAGVAYVESALMLYTALAVAWGLRAIANPNAFLRTIVLCGIMAGLACGVKITAVPMLLIAVPTAVAVVLLIHRTVDWPVRRVLLGCLLLMVIGAVVLSPWLIRNFIWCGNPLFPVAMKTLGRDHFSPDQVVRFVVAHSPTAKEASAGARAQILWSAVLAHGQYAFLLLPAGLLACLVTLRSRQTWLLIICAAFVLITWIGFTHLLARFIVMLIPIAGIAVGQVRWGKLWPAALVLLIAASIFGWRFLLPELHQQTDPPPTVGGVVPALFGGDYLDVLPPPELLAARDRHEQIALIGDAEAFLYPVPMSQLHYRAVFNVAADTEDPIDAWIGPQVRGDPHWFLVINPMEIKRLHKTYLFIPALPVKWLPHLEEQQTFFLHGNEVPKK